MWWIIRKYKETMHNTDNIGKIKFSFWEKFAQWSLTFNFCWKEKQTFWKSQEYNCIFLLKAIFKLKPRENNKELHFLTGQNKCQLKSWLLQKKPYCLTTSLSDFLSAKNIICFANNSTGKTHSESVGKLILPWNSNLRGCYKPLKDQQLKNKGVETNNSGFKA